ncbi:hypothetical protein FXO38_18834 [Capsicum annuum]|uniref:Uncharacterized protein n=1 Tax=Capsicum annuum TaxID=4072 RepID=A0A2G2XV43_CAPAN|nr:hypothetical protein FXO38_18834 [Capsicum annuum]PHT61394.1 hypothetical protein T459_34754 [Capsicum annuum]
MPITIPCQNAFEILAKAPGQSLQQKEKDTTASVLVSGKGPKNRGASFVLREASSDRETKTRRWKLKEKQSLFFCARKNNDFGRFISIVTAQGVTRSVIVIPESKMEEHCIQDW